MHIRNQSIFKMITTKKSRRLRRHFGVFLFRGRFLKYTNTFKSLRKIIQFLTCTFWSMYNFQHTSNFRPTLKFYKPPDSLDPPKRLTHKTHVPTRATHVPTQPSQVSRISPLNSLTWSFFVFLTVAEIKIASKHSLFLLHTRQKCVK